MITKEQFDKLLPLACEWAEQQENFIIKNGIPLDEDQQIDAFLIGVKEIAKVRILKVRQMPTPSIPELKIAGQSIELFSPDIIGITFRHGIFIREDHWNQRSLIVHEMSHTMQYERCSGFKAFLEQYLTECIEVGYPNGILEQEARMIEKKICI